MQFSNSDKSEHGKNAKNTLNAILAECKKYNYIKEIIKDYRCGYAKYDNKQFYCNFVIIFQDNTKWIINITTSFRSDRVKGNQWDSYNIKEIDKSISKSILVYPDSLSENEKDAFILYKTKIINHIHFSAIDEIVGESELFELIENFANKNLSVGVKKDKQGNIFEVFISDILSNKENFTKWKNNSPTGIGFHFEYYEKILNAFNLNKTEILEISATADKNIIGNLKTLGKPKTNIVVFVKTSDKTVKNFTISCKKSSANSVSVHQYSADAFSDALDKNNLKLRNLLNEFQKVGNLRDFKFTTELTEELKPYLEKLAKWVIGGDGGKINSEIQIANYVLISDEKDIFIKTKNEYAEMLLREENIYHFGTPFQWTYASGRKGKDIQLKCKILK